MFKILHELSGPLNPKTIKTDFELAAINALKTRYPAASISCCQFHFTQAHHRKLKEMNLFYLYKSDSNIKKFIKALSALSYVQKDQIKQTFNDLKNNNN